MRLPDLARSSIVRLALLYAALFGVSVLGLLAFLYGATVVVLDAETDRAILGEIDNLAEDFRREGLPGLIVEIDERLASDSGRGNVYLLVDAAAKPMAGNLAGWPAEVTRKGDWIGFPAERRSAGPTVPADIRARVFLLPGGFRILVGRDLRERQAFERLMEGALIWSVVATIGLGAGGGLLMSRWTGRRIEAINRTARDIMQGDLSRRVPLQGGGDEFDRLAQNLNDMLAEIDRLLAAMREVTDNVAHDLRQPLTRMKGRLELAARGLAADDPRRDAIEDALAEADTLLGTFQAILTIAETESASRKDMAPVDLVDLARDAADLYRPLAEDKSIVLGDDLGAGAVVLGNRHLLSLAIVNLLDNAIKYTQSGGCIDVDVDAGGGFASVTIADDGPGIPPEQRAHALQRFVRLDASRSTPGNGLGLSLVAAVARLHGGTLILGDNTPGLRAVLRLPAAPLQSSGMA